MPTSTRLLSSRSPMDNRSSTLVKSSSTKTGLSDMSPSGCSTESIEAIQSQARRLCRRRRRRWCAAASFVTSSSEHSLGVQSARRRDRGTPPASPPEPPGTLAGPPPGSPPPSPPSVSSLSTLSARPMYLRLYPSYLLPSASTRPHLVHFYALYRHLYRKTHTEHSDTECWQSEHSDYQSTFTWGLSKSVLCCVEL